MTNTAFYVYEHSRNDTGAVFYVGKGKGLRSHDVRNRNQQWMQIVENFGFTAHVICSTDCEELALLVEREKIDQLRRLGFGLVNKTSGGQGISGYVHTEESKALMRAKLAGRTGRPQTEETKAKIRAANTGVVFSKERRKKISEKRKGQEMPLHVRKILDNRMQSFRHTEATKEHLRTVNLGRKHTAESLKKMSDWQIDRPKLVCPHCNVASSVGNAYRWHFEKCKLKGNTLWQTNSPVP